MNHIFEKLLISSPNQGGLFFVHSDAVYKLDHFDTTGISWSSGFFLRALQRQPSSLLISSNKTIEINGDAASFNDIHDVLFFNEFCYLVGTSRNEILKLDRAGTEVQRWVFAGEDDSMHINCLAIWNGRVVFSAFGDFQETRGYKGMTSSRGFVQDLLSGERLIEGLSQPHSLVPLEKNLMIANSEEMEIREYAPSGFVIRSKKLDGYTRGLCATGNEIFVGLSRSRNVNLNGIDVATVVALHRKTWAEIGRIQLPANEIYSIQHIDDLNDLVKLVALVASHSSAKSNLDSSDYCKQIAVLSNETVRRGEWGRSLDAQLRTTQAELSDAVRERDSQTESFNFGISERDRAIAGLNRELIKTRSRLLMRKRIHDVELQRNGDRSERERAHLFIMHGEREQALVREHAERERQLHERLLDMQGRLHLLDQKWTDRWAVQADSASEEKAELHNQIAQLHQQIHSANRDRTDRFIALAERENALGREHCNRERRLNERLLALQAELRALDQEWAEKYATRTHSVFQKNAGLHNQISGLRHHIDELNREIANLSLTHAEQVQAISRDHVEGERNLRERLLATQIAMQKLDKEWAEKWVARQDEILIAQQSGAEVHAQLLHQIAAAKEAVAKWQRAQYIVQQELECIRSCMTWRITAPLRKFGAIFSPLKLTVAENSPESGTFHGSSSASAGTQDLVGNRDKINGHFEDSLMTANLLAPSRDHIASVGSLEDLLDQNDEAFIRAAYHTFLKRAPDAEGLAYYLRRLRRGVSKLKIIDQIRRSEEAQTHAVELMGLDEAVRRERWLTLPVINALFGRRWRNEKLLAIENQLVLANDANAWRFEQIEKAITSLQHLVVQQAQTITGTAAIQRQGYQSVDSWRAVEELLPLQGIDFLQKLFLLGLGRAPQQHEVDYYLHILDAGVSKVHAIESIFSCAECKTWFGSVRADVSSGDTDAAQWTDRKTDVVGISSTSLARSAHFIETEQPVVSVVIPVYGKIGYTLTCLKSIQQNRPKVQFEVIVVDDKSPDNSVAEISKIQGIKLIANTENLGFIRSCNRGSEEAKGKYLCFLNNDTEVTPGWLDELVRTFDEFPGTGLAGSKLVYPDGTLQEAGAIVWQDGSSWNFGRDQDPLRPVYNYAREVDYCSGASIMVPSALFRDLGGFDEHYLPAYCEDSDLALKIRDRGHRVIYQPLSVVVHHEGVTSGTDTGQGAKAFQLENSKKLFERWKKRLRCHQENGVDVDAAKDRTAKLRVLVLEHCTPTPDQDAGSVSVVNILILLRELGFQVTFIPEDNYLYMPGYTTALQRIGIEMLYSPFVRSVEEHLVDCGDRYDLVFLFRPLVVERNVEMIKKYCRRSKLLFYTHDLHHLRMMREAEMLNDLTRRREAEEMKEREFKAIRAVDGSIVVSTKELELLQPQLPNEKLHLFPLILDICGTDKAFGDRQGIVFVGGYQHGPNVDAVKYFVSQVMPILRKTLPGVCFYAVGSKPPAEILALSEKDVVVTGYVEDLPSVLDQMRVAVAPLRFGAGIKGKIGTAMAAGLPTVATTVAAEGMLLTHGENILVADGAEEFAAAITKLYKDEPLWNEISEAGLSFAREAWGAEAASRTLLHIISDLGIKAVMTNRPFRLYSTESKERRQTQATLTSPPAISVESEPDEADTYAEKIQQELKIYETQVRVHDLPAIFHYWSNKWLKPMLQEAGFVTVEEFFTMNLLAASKRTQSQRPRFVSIGAGNCDLEVSVAKELRRRGLKDFVFDCVELNPAMVSRGKKIAEEAGVLEAMRFIETDFNRWVPEVTYDGVMANHSLHHVTALEHLFAQVNSKLHRNGSFVISDMIGRNGHQRWPESYELVQKFWSELPQSYKFNLLLNRHEKEYENWDCSSEGFEGVRAQDILPLLLGNFYCETFVGFCSAIDIFVDRCFGHHFNPKANWDRDFIDRVHLADEAGLKNGELTPTHCFAVFVKQTLANPFYSRGLSPIAAIRRT